ncbi:zinc metalloprotease HtpX [archaeon]|jgi:heat shock protein HtpX|nr:zinc metalloprotease HtpX [archaeon]MBT3731047.1 zinc metalloprotease HtpX [archaeon]MBT4669715.1 zinc metalloprotease HtpX [archaeon]MBT5029864.1 zinc metalloprotease HtpX [archaeon]MBT5288436.1 zinc metalloprotease HtpX [archaeon]
MDNRIKTVILLGLLTGIILGIGSYWGYSGLVIAFVFVVVMNFFSYFFSDKIVLKMYRAKEVTENDQKDLFKIVREVASLAGIPMPKVYVVPSSNPNAFATGRNPKHAAVAVTTGIMDLLEKDELKGVIAHEISHVKNRDILISSIAATIAGVISMVGVMTRWGALFGGFGGRDGDNNIVTFLVLGIVTPIMAFLIQMAISRSREFMADESAARILHSPHGLIKALEKLESGVKKHPLKFGSKAGASLFIVNPFSMRGLTKFLSTHPPMEERIRKLKSLHV